MRRRTSMKATFLAAALAASGCRYRPGSGKPTAVPPIEPSTAKSNTKTAEATDSTSGPKETTTDDRLSDPSNAKTLEIRDDLTHTRPVAWGSWSLSSPTTVDLVFWGGPDDCDGVSAEVTETDQDVTINLSLGALPGVTECRAIAVKSKCTITLERELGDRQVRQDN